MDQLIDTNHMLLAEAAPANALVAHQALMTSPSFGLLSLTAGSERFQAIKSSLIDQHFSTPLGDWPGAVSGMLCLRA